MAAKESLLSIRVEKGEVVLHIASNSEFRLRNAVSNFHEMGEVPIEGTRDGSSFIVNPPLTEKGSESVKYVKVILPKSNLKEVIDELRRAADDLEKMKIEPLGE